MRLTRRAVVGGIATLPIACREAPPTDTPTAEPVAKPDGLVELTKLDPTIRLDIRYATPNNFTGRILYDEPRAFLERVAAEALLRAHAKARDEGFGLTIFDAYRPWSVTKKLWDATPPSKRNYVANPKQGSRHNRGCAVDLTLHDLASDGLVEMPSAYDDFSKKAHRDFMDASAEALTNRARLERLMEAEGFIGMSNEWWHFDHQDWRNYPVRDAAFGAI